jgi:uncharacterized protein YndB with AHSA1/START domain
MIEHKIPLVVRRRISASRDQIFEAFRCSEALLTWFSPNKDIQVQILQHDFQPLGRFRFRWPMPDGRKPTVHGEYLQIEKPAQIVMSWQWEPPDPLEKIPMRVSFRLIKADNATEVVITHEGIPSNAACTVHADGWQGTLTNLVSIFEKEGCS